MANPYPLITGSYLNFGGVEYPLLDSLGYDRGVETEDTNTVSTPSLWTDFIVKRSQPSIKATMYVDSGSADIPLGVKAALTASFNKKLYMGQAYALSLGYTHDTSNSGKQDYLFRFVGAVASASASS